MLTYFVFYSLSSAWANDLCQNTGGSQWCREASLIFRYSYEASAHVLTVWRTCLSHLHTEKSIPRLLLSSWKGFEQSTHRNCLFFKFYFISQGQREVTSPLPAAMKPISVYGPGRSTGLSLTPRSPSVWCGRHSRRGKMSWFWSCTGGGETQLGTNIGLLCSWLPGEL